MDFEKLEKDLEEIKNRNEQVESDKAWETSHMRRILLMIFTYLILSLYMMAIDISRPWLNSIVPTVGFLLSTLSLPFFRNIWQKRFYKK
ncbi:hypothetical protein HON36_04195 [Candidatus Parcubacteria bacterium]|jgi:hypothetical protein|nr:hypothetical protein [Candidatus Parcubacteria bacterium]MBT7228528.1 hypothetical protein [Candidatus Parcubacteria bacterium]